MNTEVRKKEFVTNSAQETERLAGAIAQNLVGGEAIELASDLGGGKTTFTRGLAYGLGSKDHVSSPTFTISKEYTGGRLKVCHFDMYRLSNPGLIANELADIIGDSEIVTVVEWADTVAHVLPKYRLKVQILTLGDEKRQVTVFYPEELNYLVENLK